MQPGNNRQLHEMPAKRPPPPPAPAGGGGGVVSDDCADWSIRPQLGSGGGDSTGIAQTDADPLRETEDKPP